MDSLRHWFVEHGLSDDGARFVAVAAAVLLSILIGKAVKGIAHVPLDRIVKSDHSLLKALKRYNALNRIGWAAATIAARTLVLPLLDAFPSVQSFSQKFIDVLMVIAVTSAISGLISASVYALEHRGKRRRLPFKVLGQALQMTLWVYACVALIALLTDKDLATVLTGLTAIGAILVYVFRDPILGWTAGVQIAANDLVAEGDWISMPKYNADGEVQEITLTIVKVKNWDQTIVSIPTYSLLSEGFTNWRGMSESGGRRITRSITIDATSIKFFDEVLEKKLSASPMISELDILPGSGAGAGDPLAGIQPTNLGCFRAWLEAILERHTKVHKDMTIMVRELPSGSRGIAVGIYIFSTEQDFRQYEKVAGEIIDHMIAVLPFFDLRIFQEPSGDDVRRAIR